MTTNSRPSSRRRRLAYGAGLLAGGALAGSVLAGTLSASAATTASTAAAGGTSAAASAGAASATASNPPQGAPRGPGGSAPVRSDEKSVSATVAATLKAEALKAVPGGTVYRVETDAGDGTYEAHMAKADGTLVTVKFDKNLAVTKVEQGMGQGDPRMAGAGAPPAGAGGGPGSP